MNKTWIGTPDFTVGRKAYEFIVMHWGVVTNLTQIDNEVLNPNRQMSYHYAIDKNEVHQYVSEENTAWHAGVWDINQRSIGICIAAGPNYPYAEQDYNTAAELIADIFRRHGRMPIKGHRDFKATECPGNLDFAKLNAKVDAILNPPPPPPPAPEPVITPPPAPAPEPIPAPTPVPEPVPVVVPPVVEPDPEIITPIPAEEKQPITEPVSGNDTNPDHNPVATEPKKDIITTIVDFIKNADFGNGGLKEFFRKWGIVFLWVSISAIANFLLQALTGFRFHDIEILNYTITAATLNLAMTAFLNGAFAGLVKWIGTKTEQAKRDCGLIQ